MNIMIEMKKSLLIKEDTMFRLSKKMNEIDIMKKLDFINPAEHHILKNIKGSKTFEDILEDVSPIINELDLRMIIEKMIDKNIIVESKF